MRTEIVAEIGVNANGDVDEAKALVDAAKIAGADVVKFQATYPRIEMSEFYMRERIEMTEEVILTHAQLEQVAAYCGKVGIEFLCTPSEVESLVWLMDAIRPKRIKMGSDNLTNLPMLEMAASYGLPIILSTGMGSFNEIQAAYELLSSKLIVAHIVLMHCTSSYPCRAEDANLRCVSTLRDIYPCRIGWSDHTTGIWPWLPSIAVGLGASIIEKHFTLDSYAAGPDHCTSLEPQDFALMVRLIRQTEAALGSSVKEIRDCERDNAHWLRKSVVARRDIDVGEQLDMENLTIMRPGFGEPPKRIRTLIGMNAVRNYKKGEMI